MEETWETKGFELHHFDLGLFSMDIPIPDLMPIYLSLKLALITSVLLLLIGLPIAYYLSQWKSKFKVIFESFISLPIVLPPSVIVFIS